MTNEETKWWIAAIVVLSLAAGIGIISAKRFDRLEDRVDQLEQQATHTYPTHVFFGNAERKKCPQAVITNPGQPCWDGVQRWPLGTGIQPEPKFRAIRG